MRDESHAAGREGIVRDCRERWQRWGFLSAGLVTDVTWFRSANVPVRVREQPDPQHNTSNTTLYDVAFGFHVNVLSVELVSFEDVLTLKATERSSLSGCRIKGDPVKESGYLICIIAPNI